MADDNEHLQPLERRLRESFSTDDSNDIDAQVEQVMRRGRRQVGVRDIAIFGFARMLSVILNLLAHLHKRPPADLGR